MRRANSFNCFVHSLMFCAVTAVGLFYANAAAQNPVVVENQNPGSTAWQIDRTHVGRYRGTDAMAMPLPPA